MRVYQYPRCSTCRKALKYLDGRGLAYEAVDITVQPPSRAELERMLACQGGELKRLFNTSGQVYRELGLSTKLPGLSQDQALDLLAANGKLIKRPFLLTESIGLVGFREADWAAL
jgi:Spx/MgsR family transcriptional regulator